MSHKIEDILKDLIQSRGIEICREPKRLQAMLQDLSVENKGKIKALIAVIEENMVSELINHPDHEIDCRVYNRLVTRLNQDAAIDQTISEWAIDCWIYALDRKAPAKPEGIENEQNKQSNQTPQPHTQIITNTQQPASIQKQSSQPIQNHPSQSISQVQQPAHAGGAGVPQSSASPPQPSRKSFPFIKMAIVLLTMWIVYNMFTDSDNEELATSQEELSSESIAEEVTAVEKVKETEPVEEDFTASVTDQQIYDFMDRYSRLSTQSINQRDFSVVEQLVDPNGEAYNKHRDYIQYLAGKGITEQSLAFEVNEIEAIDKSHFKVKTYEEYEINYNGESKKFKSFNSEYVLTVFPDYSLAVSSLADTKQIESYDIETEDYTIYNEFNEVDESAAIESMIRLHYGSISNDDFTTAYNGFSSERKRKVTMEGWVKGLQENISDDVTRIEVTQIDGNKATAYIEMTSYDDNMDGTTLVQEWGGYWHLTKENGRWTLDDPELEKVGARVE